VCECRGSEAETKGEGLIERGEGVAEGLGLHAGEEPGEIEASAECDIVEREAGIEQGGQEVRVGLDGEGGYGPSIRSLFVLSSVCLVFWTTIESPPDIAPRMRGLR
jgi:hypothetical protein